MRMEFEVLDLASVSNVQASDLPRTPPVAGDLRLRGIPFAIGTPSKGEHRYLGLGEELKVEPVEIAIDRPASHLLFAFSMLDSPLRAGGPFGYPCMELTIKTAAAEHHVTVREGFEIGALPAREFEFPMLAWPGQIGQHGATPRRSVDRLGDASDGGGDSASAGLLPLGMEEPCSRRQGRVAQDRAESRTVHHRRHHGRQSRRRALRSVRRANRSTGAARAGTGAPFGTTLGTGRSRGRWLCLAAPAPHPGGVPRRDGRMGRTGGR